MKHFRGQSKKHLLLDLDCKYQPTGTARRGLHRGGDGKGPQREYQSKWRVGAWGGMPGRDTEGTGARRKEECSPHPTWAATLSSRLPMFREGYRAGPWDQSEFILFTSIYPGPGEGPSHHGVPVPAGVQSPPGGNKGNRREQSWGRKGGGSGLLRSCWGSTQAYAGTRHNCSASS